MLEIKKIDVFYGDVQVIWEVSFEVKQKEIVALIGANGAGKSTILKNDLRYPETPERGYPVRIERRSIRSSLTSRSRWASSMFPKPVGFSSK